MSLLPDACPLCRSPMDGLFCTSRVCPLGERSPYHPQNPPMSMAEARRVLGLDEQEEEP